MSARGRDGAQQECRAQCWRAAKIAALRAVFSAAPTLLISANVLAVVDAGCWRAVCALRRWHTRQYALCMQGCIRVVIAAIAAISCACSEAESSSLDGRSSQAGSAAVQNAAGRAADADASAVESDDSWSDLETLEMQITEPGAADIYVDVEGGAYRDIPLELPAGKMLKSVAVAHCQTSGIRHRFYIVKIATDWSTGTLSERFVSAGLDGIEADGWSVSTLDYTNEPLPIESAARYVLRAIATASSAAAGSIGAVRATWGDHG